MLIEEPLSAVPSSSLRFRMSTKDSGKKWYLDGF